MRRHGRSSHLRRSVTVGCAAVLAAILIPGLAQASAGTSGALGLVAVPGPVGPAPVTDPASLVDPFVGTGSGGAVVGQVDTFPGADVPFGMLQWSPDTPSRPAGGGYNYADSDITGFSLTHLSGPGCAIAGDIPVLPTTGSLTSDPAALEQPFSHANEQARAGYYGVRLGSGGSAIGTRITVTARSGLASFRYPASHAAHLVLKVAGSANGSSAATFATAGHDEVTGSVTSGHFCGQPDNYTLYFAARFDRPFTSSGTWGGSSGTDVRTHPGATRVQARGVQHPAATPVSIHPGVAAAAAAAGPRSVSHRENATQGSATQGSGVVAGGWLNFDTTRNPVVKMQVAVSYVSVAGAQANLRADATSWNVNQVAAAATARWNAQLNKIAVAGGTLAQRRTFYTALYHALLHPNLFSDADGQYLGFDGKVHTVAAGHSGFYTNFSGWDI